MEAKAIQHNRKELNPVNHLERLNLELHSLVLFHALGKDELLRKLSALLSSPGKVPLEQVMAYSDFAATLLERGGNLTDCLLERVLDEETVYVRRRATGGAVDTALDGMLQHELGVLEGLSRLTGEEVASGLDYEGPLPGWQTREVDFLAVYQQRMENLATVGYGPFARHHMFLLKAGQFQPVLWPDPMKLADLTGYETERQAVLENTLALLQGKPAANALLYGDAGTGKSTTVKAIVNTYCHQGLRLIEVAKHQLGSLPEVIAALRDNPLKFVLFIDDLSFDRDSDEFSTLKATLEGSALARTPNVAIYATSNRRHLVRETFADRTGDDVHVNETLQELGSLADRFGLSVGFFRPDKALYLEIVHDLAAHHGITMDSARLDAEAERFALQRAGRSPRIARQFVEALVRGQGGNRGA